MNHAMRTKLQNILSNYVLVIVL